MTIFTACAGGMGEQWFEPTDATDPTQAQPGSPDKVAAMVARIERGEDLWHPGDRSCAPDLGDMAWRDRGISWHNRHAE